MVQVAKLKPSTPYEVHVTLFELNTQGGGGT